jgi:hypothetical protein
MASSYSSSSRVCTIGGRTLDELLGAKGDLDRDRGNAFAPEHRTPHGREPDVVAPEELER